MVTLYWLSAQSGLIAPIRLWDKLAHVGAYTILGLLSLRAFHGGLNWLGLRPTLLALLTTMTYGLIDELHQARVPGRVTSLQDWIADALGALAAVLILAVSLAVRSALPGRGALPPARAAADERGAER